MLRYGKMAQSAVAIASRLAEIYYHQPGLASSVDISKNRKIPRPLVAKILTILAKQGLVIGSPGPGGGYKLAKQPEEVFLFDIVSIFEQTRTKRPCPLGPHWCGTGDHCCLHDKFTELRHTHEEFLKATNLGGFKDIPRAKKKNHV